jgi:CubicO group peptidase (beta-lactamase class C family)
VFRRTRGLADVEAGAAITPRTRFDLASVSKQFTGVAIARLVARGALSLDEPAAGIVPELPPCARAVTVRHLLSHRSGLREFDAPAALAGAWYTEGLDNPRVLDLLSRQPALEFEPGSRLAYANTNYVVLAEIVARRSGVDFARFMAEQVFAPLGMRDARVNAAPDAVLHDKARSYQGSVPPRLLSARSIAVTGSTSVNASLDDLVARERRRAGAAEGDAAIAALLLQRDLLADGSRSEYAFGQWHGERDGLAFTGHLGLVAGFRASLRRFESRGIAVIFLANDGADATWRRARRIEDLFLGLPAAPPDVPDGQFVPPSASPPVDAVPLVGLYYADELRAAYELVRDGDGIALVHAVNGRIPLRALPAADTFASSRWYLPRLSLRRDAAGRVEGFAVDAEGASGIVFRRL